MPRIADYTDLKILGRGAFGEVSLVSTIEKKIGVGRHPNYGVPVCFYENVVCYYALKRIQIRSREEQQKTEKEMEVLQRLNHFHVVQFEESFTKNGVVHLVFEYCEGGDLNNFVLQNPFISKNRLSNLTYQIGRGLEYLHESNIIHRDIKPDNMMIVHSLDVIIVKLADFGLARVWETFSYQNPYYDFQYSPKGPPYYTAPEVFRDHVTMKSDIFSLGCLIMAIYSQTTVPWTAGKKLLAPYIGSAAHQICHATEQQKDEYIKEHINPQMGSQIQFRDIAKIQLHVHEIAKIQFQELVLAMVRCDWRRRPNAQEVLKRMRIFH